MKLTASLFFGNLFALNMNGASFIDDDVIVLGVAGLILVHIFTVAAYLGKIEWLRYICAFLYLPVFLIPLVLTMLQSSLVFAFIPFGLFYYFFIIRSRTTRDNNNNNNVT